MSKKANHWYLLSFLADSLLAAKKPRFKPVLFSLTGTALVVLLFMSGAVRALPAIKISPSSMTFFTIGFAFVLCIFIFLRQSWKYGAAFRHALASVDPKTLVAVVRRPLENPLIPDSDAHAAHAAAMAYALYGSAEDATAALSAVDWRSRAPLIQALGLIAEGTIVLLCRRDPRRALELYREADQRSAVSGRMPGARTSQLSRAAFIAVGQAIMGTETSADVATLETMAGRKRYPALQLLATCGLAAAMDHAGNQRRADELRSDLRRTAPHCQPLHLSPAEWRGGASVTTDRRIGLSSIASPGTPNLGSAATEQAIKAKFTRTMRTLLLLWIGGALLLGAAWAVLNMSGR